MRALSQLTLLLHVLHTSCEFDACWHNVDVSTQQWCCRGQDPSCFDATFTLEHCCAHIVDEGERAHTHIAVEGERSQIDNLVIEPLDAGKSNLWELAHRTFGYQNPITNVTHAKEVAGFFAETPRSIIDWDISEQYALWQTLAQGGQGGGLVEEFQQYPASLAKSAWITVGDRFVLYSMLRVHRPRLMIEIGSGDSTTIAANALHRNRAEGYPCRHICIEPFRAASVKADVELIRMRVQDVGHSSILDDLRSGDVLFIDSSHTMQPYGDVIFLYIFVLPRLKDGVLVHIHDIHLPWDYPAKWILSGQRMYTEQWLLAAFLYGNRHWNVLFAAHYFFVTFAGNKSLFGNNTSVSSLPDALEGGSLWMRRGNPSHSFT